jgi:hypothetical protein
MIPCHHEAMPSYQVSSAALVVAEDALYPPALGAFWGSSDVVPPFAKNLSVWVEVSGAYRGCIMAFRIILLHFQRIRHVLFDPSILHRVALLVRSLVLLQRLDLKFERMLPGLQGLDGCREHLLA